jgi:excisionase family DNA binding protein
MWMTREDAARALGVTVRTLRRYVASGKIRAEGDRGEPSLLD